MSSGPVLPEAHGEANPAASRAPTRATPAPSAPPASGDVPGGSPYRAPGGCQGRHSHPPSTALMWSTSRRPGRPHSRQRYPSRSRISRRRRSHQRPRRRLTRPPIAAHWKPASGNAWPPGRRPGRQQQQHRPGSSRADPPGSTSPASCFRLGSPIVRASLIADWSATRTAAA